MRQRRKPLAQAYKAHQFRGIVLAVMLYAL